MEDDESSDCTFVFNRASELWKIEPAYVALPLSYAAKTVVEALFTTAKAEVVAALSAPFTCNRLYGLIVPIPRLPETVSNGAAIVTLVETFELWATVM